MKLQISHNSVNFFIFSANYKEDRLGEMMKTLNRELNGALTSGEFFQNYFLVHNSKFWGMTCLIDHGIAGDEILPGIDAFAKTGYYYSPLFRNAERFLFFAFL